MRGKQSCVLRANGGHRRRRLLGIRRTRHRLRPRCAPGFHQHGRSLHPRRRAGIAAAADGRPRARFHGTAERGPAGALPYAARSRLYARPVPLHRAGQPCQRPAAAGRHRQDRCPCRRRRACRTGGAADAAAAEAARREGRDARTDGALQGPRLPPFQGYYFAKPTIVSGRQLSASQLGIIRLINLVARDAELPELEESFKRRTGPDGQPAAPGQRCRGRLRSPHRIAAPGRHRDRSPATAALAATAADGVA